jgi:purine-nucleoside phosphorylase
MSYTLAYYQKSADYLKEKFGGTPEIAMILGSGLQGLADEIENPVFVPYQEIPNFLVSTVKTHAGRMIYGTLAGHRVVCMQGRFHSYEGYTMEQLAAPVRVMKLLGAEKLIVTNAAGAVNLDYRPGDIMIIKDHLKFALESPMCGPNIDELGPRFFDISKMYTPSLRKLARVKAEGSGLNVHEGVYMFFTGPQFETPAEVRAARILGADAAGMSTVNEALTAAHMGMPLLGLTVITNMAAGILEQPLSDEEVNEVANTISTKFASYVKSILKEM